MRLKLPYKRQTLKNYKKNLNHKKIKIKTMRTKPCTRKKRIERN